MKQEFEIGQTVGIKKKPGLWKVAGLLIRFGYDRNHVEYQLARRHSDGGLNIFSVGDIESVMVKEYEIESTQDRAQRELKEKTKQLEKLTEELKKLQSEVDTLSLESI